MKTKLGTIKDGEWTDVPTKCALNVDVTMAIMIRDLLTKFKKVSKCIPIPILKECNMDEDLAMEQRDEILDKIIEGADFYARKSIESLTAGENQVLAEHSTEIAGNNYFLKDDGTPEEDGVPEDVKKVLSKLRKIQDKKDAGFKKSLTLLSKWITHLWW